ncbi:MAG: threonine synthase [Firmicutes bacterium]|nr:threonine synthase [Bacillota bacterium]
MNYKSTRGKAPELTISQAIIKGIAEDGGLYVPEVFPKLSCDWEALSKLSYIELAKEVLRGYLDNFSEDEINYCIEGAYTDKFEADEIVPVVKADGVHFAELYHGPTAAFKDMALSLMPYLLTTSIKKEGEEKTVVILVSTSGDTGMAALKGFENVPGTEVVVFFPDGAVSPVQERQMRTAEGRNAHVFSIFGNFDDAQTSQKQILNDKAFASEMDKYGIRFSAANSMNIGRLIPQIVYYVWSYLAMIREGEIKAGDKINIVVPSGNFGNILSAYYAFRMGLPVKKFICASNKNKVLTDFFNTGVYDTRRDFYVTNAPSMDILVSSNLERLLYHMTENGAYVAELMAALNSGKHYEVNADLKEKLGLFAAGYAEEDAIEASIGALYKKSGYLMDTHTSVAYTVYKDYLEKTGDNTPAVIASTASPYKFVAAVSRALGLPREENDFKQIESLNAYTGVRIPKGLKDLDKRTLLHIEAIAKESMKDRIRDEFKGL